MQANWRLPILLCAPLLLAQSAEELLRLGELRLKQERLAEARALFERATKAAPSAAAWENLGMAALLSGDLRQASSAARQLLRLDAGNYNARLILGLASFEDGKYEEALAQVGGLAGADPLALSLRAACLAALGRRSDGNRERARLASVAVDPRDAVLSARIFRSEALQEYALEMLELASAQGPARLTVLRELGNLYRMLRNWSRAESSYRRALAMSPGDPRLLARLAEAVSRQDRPQEGAALLEQAQNSLTKDPAVLIDFGVTCLQMRYLLEARAALLRAVSLSPDNPEAHYHTGVVEAVLGRAPEAERQYRAALALVPKDPRFHLALGHLLLENVRSEEARPELEIASHSPATAAQALLYLARIEKLEGNPEEARRMLRRAAQLSPRDAETLAELAAVELTLDDAGSAASHIEAALKLDPRCAKAHIHRARLLGLQGKAEEADKESRLGEKLRNAESEAHSLKAVKE